MRLEWIEDILAVLDTGSFAKAADARLVTHSAFTRRIRVVEDALGCELFDRSRKPVTLRPHVGQQERELRLTAARLHKLRSLLSDDGRTMSDTIRFACQHAISATISPRLIRDMCESDGLRVKVEAADRSTCLSDLLTGQTDFAVIFESAFDPAPVFKVSCDTHRLGPDRLIPVCSPDPTFGILKQLERDELPLISFPNDIYLGELQNLAILPAIPSGFTIRHRAEAGLTFAVQQYVTEGIGVGWLPRSLVQDQLASGTLVDLCDRLPWQEIFVTVLRLSGQEQETLDLAWQKILLN